MHKTYLCRLGIWKSLAPKGTGFITCTPAVTSKITAFPFIKSLFVFKPYPANVENMVSQQMADGI
jgi:hypothetical protein